MKKILRFLFRPSPFKAGLAVTLLIFTLHPHAMVTWSTTSISQFINGMDDRIHDFMFIIRGREVPNELVATVIDIDEKSLDELGQWPWPRTRIAALVEHLSAARPKAIGFDVVFAEPDRTSLKSKIPELIRLSGKSIPLPKELDEDGWPREEEAVTADYRKVLQTLLGRKEGELPSAVYDNDRILARAIESCPQVVLGYFWQTHQDGPLDMDNLSVPIGKSFFGKTEPGFEYVSPFKKFAQIPHRPILNLEMLEDAADDRAGCFNASFLDSGTVRRVPLIWEYHDGNIYPTLTLQMLRVALGADQGFVRFDNYGVDRIEIETAQKKVSIKTDRIAQIYVNFRGGQHTFPYISAADIIRGEFDRSLIRDKYVLLGTSAGGLMDLRSIAFERGYPGVEVHANVIDNLVHGDYLIQPRDAFVQELILILVLGILTAALVAWTRPLVGMPLSALLFAGTVCANYILMFRYHTVLNLTYPLLSMLAVQVVVQTFNFFSEGRQKRFIKDAFGTYLSPDLVNEVTKSPDLLRLTGEEKELTILFSDIRNFTSISERLPAKELSTFLNEYLTPMTEIVMESHGTVDKFIGDAVMAFWGAPVDLPDHAARAARAALKMGEVLTAKQPEWEARGLPHIEIGIGINTGRVSVGNMGSTHRFDYTVMGDSVNLASRLEGQNKNYGSRILTSEATRIILGETFFCRRLDCIRVKGKQEGVWVYEILCEGAPPPALRREVGAFEEMLAHYQNRDFEKAKKMLAALSDGGDTPLYALYRKRIETYLESPPPEDWDGITTLTTK